MASLADLIDRAWVDDRRDAEEISRLKGDLRMVRFISRAIRTRQRPLREDFRIGHGVQWLYLSAEKSAEIVSEARRRFRTHNAARRFVEAEFFQALALSGRESLDPKGLAERLRGDIQIREALEWMWPVLTPAQLLNDCFGSRALIRAADSELTEREVEALYRPRSKIAEEVRWSASDASLLDEARAALGARPGRRDLEAIRTYGHIVVDEIQDLSPMDLRMLERRSLNGSMTVVGDIAQATGAWAHNDWDSILEHLPDRRPVNQYELTVGYRIPAPLMDIATKVLVKVAPDLTPPRSVRSDGEPPTFISAQLDDQQNGLVSVIKEELNTVGAGNLAVITAASQIEEIEELLSTNKVDFGRPTRAGLDSSVTVVPVGLVKGLEVDAAVVVEPKRIAEEQEQGLRALYVALTRATKRVAIIHSDSLPEVLRQF